MSDKVLNIKEIMERIPHRYPFLLIDRVIDYEKDKWIKAVKNVTMNEQFFTGHFPSEPVMPGVLIVEAMAQAVGVLAHIDGKKDDKITYFIKIDNVKFRKPVTPGDQIVMEVSVTKVMRKTMLQTHGVAKVNDEVVCEADLMFATVDKKQ